MNFDYDEQQQLLADSVRRYLAKGYDFEARKRIVAGEGWSAQAWVQFAEMGLFGLPLSTDHGGFGGGAVDLMGVMEAFGEALVLEPYLSHVMAARLVERGGRGDILGAVAEGKLKLAFAHGEVGGRVTVVAKGDRLSGEKHAVIGAPIADKLVVSAKTSDGIGLFLVDRPEVRARRTVDERLAGDLFFANGKADRLSGGLAELDAIVDFAAALSCAEAVGAMQFSCTATLEYLKARKQFGVPIGTFQALQHRMVDMFVALEQARSMACLACSVVDQSRTEAERKRAVSAAKIKIADAARHISQESVQLHGGMGMTEELKVSHAFRRLTVLAREFGDADHHLERFATL